MPSRTIIQAKQDVVLHAKQDSITSHARRNYTPSGKHTSCRQRHNKQQKGTHRNDRRSFAEHWQMQNLYGRTALFNQVHGDMSCLKTPESKQIPDTAVYRVPCSRKLVNVFNFTSMVTFKLQTWPKTLGDDDTFIMYLVGIYTSCMHTSK